MSSTPARNLNSVNAAVAGSTAFRIVSTDGTLDENEIDHKPSSPMDWSIDEILDEAGDLAALPHVVLKLIQMTGDSSVTASDLEKVILTDQAVAARVLALANSAYFGLPRKIFFVREAVVFLGFKTVRNLAMTVNAINMFLGRTDTLSIARAQLWHHSLNVALASRMLAEHLNRTGSTNVNSEQAFTAGLLHDIGKMVLDLALPDRYMAALKLINDRGLRLYDIEDKIFPFRHGEVGAALATKWNLPAALCDAIKHHHDPEAAEVDVQLVAVIALANELTDYCSKLVDGPEEIAETAPAMHGASCEILHISPEQLPDLIMGCQTEFEKGMALHSCV